MGGLLALGRGAARQLPRAGRVVAARAPKVAVGFAKMSTANLPVSVLPVLRVAPTRIQVRWAGDVQDSSIDPKNLENYSAIPKQVKLYDFSEGKDPHEFRKVRVPDLTIDDPKVLAVQQFVIPMHGWGDDDFRRVMESIPIHTWKDRKNVQMQGGEVSSRLDMMFLLTHYFLDKTHRYFGKVYKKGDPKEVRMAVAGVAMTYIGVLAGFRKNFLAIGMCKDPSNGNWVAIRRFGIADVFHRPSLIKEVYPTDYLKTSVKELISLSIFRDFFCGDMDGNARNLLWGNNESKIMRMEKKMIDPDHAFPLPTWDPNPVVDQKHTRRFFGGKIAETYTMGSIGYNQAQCEKYGGADAYFKQKVDENEFGPRGDMATLCFAYFASGLEISKFLDLEVPREMMVNAVNASDDLHSMFYSSRLYTKELILDPRHLQYQEWLDVFAAHLRTNTPLRLRDVLSGEFKCDVGVRIL